MRTAHRILFLVTAMTVMIAAFAVPAYAGPEGTLLSRINNSRASAGLAPLERYGGITDDARAQAERMRAEQRVFHNTNLAGSTNVWQGLGENVGVGMEVGELHDAFMASSGHRANILGDFNYVGIGAATDDNGLLWVSVIFMRAAPGLNGGADTTTTTTAAPPTDQPVDAAPTSTTTTAATTTTTQKAADEPAQQDAPKALTTSGNENRDASVVPDDASSAEATIGLGRPTAPFAD
jgi:uncharacterized protein YkwD